MQRGEEMIASRKEMKKFQLSAYELCPCESGKKYKFCCYMKSKENTDKNLNYSSQRILYEAQKALNETDFEVCFAFDNTKCTETIVGAHSLQNNGVLNKIAEDGHVYGMIFDIMKNNPSLKFNRIGKNKASTFLGFCNYHDKEYFSPIEDQEYEQSPLQNYLFAYRAFCFERHRKLRLKKSFTKLFQKHPQATRDLRILNMYQACLLDLKDKDIEYERFKKIYEDEDYSNLVSFVKEVPFKVGFTGTTAVAVNVDINGKETVDIYDYKESLFVPSLYISVIPKEQTSLIIVTRHIEDDCYRQLLLSLEEEKDEELVLKYISFCLYEFSENVFFSPKVVHDLTDRQKNIIFSAFYSSLEHDLYKRFHSMCTGFRLNLFDFKIN